jgi:hypothetical protein
MPVSGNTRIAPVTCSSLPRPHALVQVFAGPRAGAAIDGVAVRVARPTHREPVPSSVDDGADHELQHDPAPSPRAEEKPLRDRIVKETPPRASDYERKAAESAYVGQARNGFEPVRPSSSALV